MTQLIKIEYICCCLFNTHMHAFFICIDLVKLFFFDILQIAHFCVCYPWCRSQHAIFVYLFYSLFSLSRLMFSNSQIVMKIDMHVKKYTSSLNKFRVRERVRNIKTKIYNLRTKIAIFHSEKLFFSFIYPIFIILLELT